ncbi:MAG: hypothetical protein QOF70_3762 [Acetobacteraceae bacterium]|jgi:hypothetical protein|nr:hypothetical protein [Acetobacteraceae bacterium]
MRRFLTLAAGAALGLAPCVVTGVALAAPNQSAQNQVPAQAPAQSSGSIPDGTIGKAGAALHDMVKLQEKYQGKMETAPADQKKGLGDQANAEAVQTIQSHGLSVQEYANVVRTAQTDPRVKQRLLNAANIQD